MLARARGTRAMTQVVCLGATALDMVARVERPLGPNDRLATDRAVLGGGGVAATAAVTLARLGVEVAFVGSVGDDDAGRLIRAGLAREGVDVRALAVVPGSSAMGPVNVEGSSTGHAIAAHPPDEPPPVDGLAAELCDRAAWVHADDLGWRSVRALRAAGVTTPISLRHGDPTPDVDLGVVDLYAPTEARLRLDFPGLDTWEAIDAALGAGPRIVAVTRGAEGSVAGWRDASGGTWCSAAEAFPVDVASTLGAGDVFHGALLAGLVCGLTVPEALRQANAAAALSCRGLDGRSAIPARAELDAFLAAS